MITKNNGYLDIKHGNLFQFVNQFKNSYFMEESIIFTKA